jgi:lysozyme
MAMHPAVRRLSTVGVLACSLAVPCVSQFEGRWLTAKPDRLAYGIPTVCFGETEGVKIGDHYTPQECADMLAKKLPRYAEEIEACIFVPISAKTEASFISFSYNIGTHGFCHSGTARHLNRYEYVEACNAMLAWNKAGGVVVRGLEIRRSKERNLCMEGL